MQRLISSILMIMLCIQGIGQETKKSGSCTHELGFNATSLFKNFLAFNESDIPSSPYVFTYKLIKGNMAFRASFAYNYIITKPEPSTITITSSTSTSSVALGVEKRKEVGNKWLFFAGIDGFMDGESFVTKANGDFDNTVVSDRTASLGFAPLMGIQFRISDSVSLLTEALLPIAFGQTIHKEESENFPEINDTSKSSLMTVSSVLPTSLFLVIEL